MFDTPDLSFAIDTVRKASQLVRHVQQEMISPGLTKEDRSPVTVGDFAAQALVAHCLEERFGGDPLVGEEDATELRTNSEVLAGVTGFVQRLVPAADGAQVCEWIDRGGAMKTGSGGSLQRFWTLDPIDGTKGFLRGEQYAVALALLVDGKVQLGVLGCPNLTGGAVPEVGGPGSLLVAVAGEGTWVLPMQTGAGSSEPARVHVSDQADPAAARLLRSAEAGHTNVGKIGELVEHLSVRADPVCMDSQAKYAVLATGHGELLFRLISSKRPDYREKIWDQAAGSLVVEEAGGRITDLDGKPLDFSHGRTLAKNRGVVASNGHLHEAALAALREVGA